MTQETNSASRLLRLMTNARDRHASMPTHTQWAERFELDVTETTPLLIAVMEHLIWVNEEISSVRRGMEKTGMPPFLYAPHLDSLQNCLSPLQFNNDWINVKVALSNEALVSLGYCAEILPKDETEVSADDLEAIRGLLSEFEVLLSVSTLPEVLRQVMQHHVELLHRALCRYPHGGIKSLKEAAFTAAGELLCLKAAGVNVSDSEEGKKLDELWSRVNTVADAAIKVEGLYGLGKTVMDLIA